MVTTSASQWKNANSVTVRYGRATITFIYSYGPLRVKGLPQRLEKYKTKEISPETLVNFYLRSRIRKTSPSFEWRNANKKHLLKLLAENAIVPFDVSDISSTKVVADKLLQAAEQDYIKHQQVMKRIRERIVNPTMLSVTSELAKNFESLTSTLLFDAPSPNILNVDLDAASSPVPLRTSLPKAKYSSSKKSLAKKSKAPRTKFVFDPQEAEDLLLRKRLQENYRLMGRKPAPAIDELLRIKTITQNAVALAIEETKAQAQVQHDDISLKLLEKIENLTQAIEKQEQTIAKQGKETAHLEENFEEKIDELAIITKDSVEMLAKEVRSNDRKSTRLGIASIVVSIILWVTPSPLENNNPRVIYPSNDCHASSPASRVKSSKPLIRNRSRKNKNKRLK